MSIFNIPFSGEPQHSGESSNLSKHKFYLYMGSQKTASKESQYPIFVALERGLNVSMGSEHSTRRDRVTNIGYWLSLEASLLLRKSESSLRLI